MPKIEIQLDALLTDSDWAQVFADENDGNVTKAVHVAPPGSSVSAGEFARDDVAEIIAAVNGENNEADWLGVFKLKDGRFAVASGGCDYTGWDCQAGNCLTVAASMDDLLMYGLSNEERERLEI